MAPSRANEQPPLPCLIWAWSDTSNVHVAQDLFWFGEDYTPFKSSIKTPSGTSVEAVGIETVELLAKESPSRIDRGSHSIIHLKKVLHVPNTICNIIGRPLMDDYRVTICFWETPSGTTGYINNLTDGRPMAFFQAVVQSALFWGLRLSGPPVGHSVGPSPLKSSETYPLDAFWPRPPGEQQRFAKSMKSSQGRPVSAEMPTGDKRTELKKYHRSESKWVQVYDLLIDREMVHAEICAMLEDLISVDDEEDTA